MMLNSKIVHSPVLKQELIDLLSIKPNGTYVDCTGGFGGHSEEILKHLSKDGKLICLDQDAEAISFLQNKFKKNNNVQIIKTNFANILKVIKTKVDGIIFDLGVSSYMFDTAQRGFSYRLDGPLDMRMDQSSERCAFNIINESSDKELIQIFKEFGEIKSPYKVVNAIIKYREAKPINTTLELTEIIKNNVPPKNLYMKKHPARTYFQALRIAVNQELEILQRSLIDASKLLKIDGRMLVITFHSLEDRIVKQLFNELTDTNDLMPKEVPIIQNKIANFKSLTKKPIIPSDKEIETNYRAHSSKLRGITKIGDNHE